jgi:predicted DCC family thiol-disulfide oxidoreductase YuxK
MPTLLYDADCRLCRFVARVVDRLDRDRELALLPLQDPGAAPLVAELPEHERHATWRIAHEDGSLVGRGEGAPVLLRTMTLTRPAGRLLAHVPPRALDAAYDLFARHRGRLGRLVPDGPAPRRLVRSQLDAELAEARSLDPDRDDHDADDGG